MPSLFATELIIVGIIAIIVAIVWLIFRRFWPRK